MKLSVVLSVYNGAAHLAATLDSILAQTFREFELIVLDDGSRDATPEILAGYARRDDRIRVVTQANTGLTRALIRGCQWARGTYIARHDAGDLSEPQRFERQLALLERNERLALVSCWTEFVGPELEPLWIARGSGRGASPVALVDLTAPHAVADGPTHHGSAMFRHDAYERSGGYRAELAVGQDWDLWYRIADHGDYQLVPEVLYRARVEPESISSASKETQEQIAMLSEEALRARRRGEPDAEILARAANVKRTKGSRAAGLYFIGEALRRNRHPRARYYLGEALRARPWHMKTWVRWMQALLTQR